MQTPFTLFDDKITDDIEAILDAYAADLRTIGESYAAHIRPQSVIDLLETLPEYVRQAAASEGKTRVEASLISLIRALEE